MLRNSEYVTLSGFTTSDFFYAEGDALGSGISPFCRFTACRSFRISYYGYGTGTFINDVTLKASDILGRDNVPTIQHQPRDQKP